MYCLFLYPQCSNLLLSSFLCYMQILLLDTNSPCGAILHLRKLLVFVQNLFIRNSQFCMRLLLVLNNSKCHYLVFFRIFVFFFLVKRIFYVYIFYFIFYPFIIVQLLAYNFHSFVKFKYSLSLAPTGLTKLIKNEYKAFDHFKLSEDM